MLTEWSTRKEFALPSWLQLRSNLAVGLLLCASIAFLAQWLSQASLFAANGLSSLTLAIVLGLLVGNTVMPAVATAVTPGVNYAKQYLLRLGIILYGFKLTFQSIGLVGLGGLLVDATVLLSTFFLTVLLGCRVFKLEKTTAMLIGIGHSICGAAAIMAAEPVLKARAEQVTIAVTTIVLFGTLAIFVYPQLYYLNAHYGWWPHNDVVFGLFTGSTVHEVAQVVAVGDAVSAQATDTAVIAKMVRVMLLAPFLLVLSVWVAKQSNKGAQTMGALVKSIQVPWFAFVFIAVAGFNSFGWLAEDTLAHIAVIDTVVLSMAMAALGLSTDVRAFRRAGFKPLLLAALLFIWLVLGGGFINYIGLRLFGV